MNFGEAIEAMKNGKFATRKGWNGKNMYLWYMPPATVKSEWCKEPHLKAIADDNGGKVECLGSIRMKTADNKVLTGWLASQTDIMAEDWAIYDSISDMKSDMWNYRGVRYLRCNAGVRYWKNAEVNGEEDDDDNPRIPCIDEDGRWNILIDIKTGQVLNWTKGVTAKVFYKVCDDGIYTAYNNEMNKVYEIEDYVPDILAIDDTGYGDYIALTIDENGYIKDWPDNEDIKYQMDEFLDNEDE